MQKYLTYIAMAVVLAVATYVVFKSGIEVMWAMLFVLIPVTGFAVWKQDVLIRLAKRYLVAYGFFTYAVPYFGVQPLGAFDLNSITSMILEAKIMLVFAFVVGLVADDLIKKHAKI